MQDEQARVASAPVGAFERLQAIARGASTFFLAAAGVVFFGGGLLLTVVLFQLGDGAPFGSTNPSFSEYAFLVLVYGSQVILPAAVLAVAGIGLRLYAEAHLVQDERHFEALDGKVTDDVDDGDEEPRRD